MSHKPVRDVHTFLIFQEYLRECGLEADARVICLRHAVSLRDIYLDSRGPSVHAARLEVWWWLSTKCHRSYSEIGRLFDRESSSIIHAMKKLRERAAAMGKEIADISVAHDTARKIAAETSEALRQQGSRLSERIKASKRK